MLEISYKGDFSKTGGVVNAIKKARIRNMLEDCGREGVEALESATPVDTGLTAASWSYEIEENQNGFILRWNNSNVQNGVNIALILDRGHGKRNGGYVAGRRYIKPSLDPIFEKIRQRAIKEVSG